MIRQIVIEIKVLFRDNLTLLMYLIMLFLNFK